MEREKNGYVASSLRDGDVDPNEMTGVKEAEASARYAMSGPGIEQTAATGRTDILGLQRSLHFQHQRRQTCEGDGSADSRTEGANDNVFPLTCEPGSSIQVNRFSIATL